MQEAGVPHARASRPCTLCSTGAVPLGLPRLAPLQDVLEEMEAEYAKERDTIKAAVKERGIEVSSRLPGPVGAVLVWFPGDQSCVCIPGPPRPVHRPPSSSAVGAASLCMLLRA